MWDDKSDKWLVQTVNACFILTFNIVSIVTKCHLMQSKYTTLNSTLKSLVRPTLLTT